MEQIDQQNPVTDEIGMYPRYYEENANFVVERELHPGYYQRLEAYSPFTGGTFVISHSGFPHLYRPRMEQVEQVFNLPSGTLDSVALQDAVGTDTLWYVPEGYTYEELMVIEKELLLQNIRTAMELHGKQPDEFKAIFFGGSFLMNGEEVVNMARWIQEELGMKNVTVRYNIDAKCSSGGHVLIESVDLATQGKVDGPMLVIGHLAQTKRSLGRIDPERANESVYSFFGDGTVVGVIEVDALSLVEKTPLISIPDVDGYICYIDEWELLVPSDASGIVQIDDEVWVSVQPNPRTAPDPRVKLGEKADRLDAYMNGQKFGMAMIKAVLQEFPKFMEKIKHLTITKVAYHPASTIVVRGLQKRLAKLGINFDLLGSYRSFDGNIIGATFLKQFARDQYAPGENVLCVIYGTGMTTQNAVLRINR